MDAGEYRGHVGFGRWLEDRAASRRTGQRLVAARVCGDVPNRERPGGRGRLTERAVARGLVNGFACLGRCLCSSAALPIRRPTLYELLAPVSGQLAVAGVVSYGSISSALGALATTLERYEEAEGHFETAAEIEERLGAPLSSPAPTPARPVRSSPAVGPRTSNAHSRCSSGLRTPPGILARRASREKSRSAAPPSRRSAGNRLDRLRTAVFARTRASEGGRHSRSHGTSLSTDVHRHRHFRNAPSKQASGSPQPTRPRLVRGGSARVAGRDARLLAQCASCGGFKAQNAGSGECSGMSLESSHRL